MQMNRGEDLRISRGPFGPQFHLAMRDPLAGFLQNPQHIIGAARARAEQQHLHRPRPLIAPPARRRPVHDDLMP